MLRDFPWGHETKAAFSSEAVKPAPLTKLFSVLNLFGDTRKPLSDISSLRAPWSESPASCHTGELLGDGRKGAGEGTGRHTVKNMGCSFKRSEFGSQNTQTQFTAICYIAFKTGMFSLSL